MPLVGRKRALLTLAPSALAFALAILAVVAGCATGPVTYEPGSEPAPGFFPVTPVTNQGVATSDLYNLTFVIAVIVFVLVEGLLIFITLRFRRRQTDIELPPQIHGSNRLEILWTIVPAITVTFLFAAALINLNSAETEARTANPSVVVDVTGFQWQWTFEYAAQNLSFTGAGRNGPEMVLPTNETVRIRLHANDVIHSFYVPQFLYKKDVVPGRVNEFDVNVKDAGTFAGQCAEFCGLAHADMHFTVRAVSRPDFDQWVIDAQRAQPSAAPALPSGAPSLTITAVNVTTFDPATLDAPANEPIAIDFHNADTTQIHNFAIEHANPDGTDWIGMPFTDPGQTATYVTPALPAGTYQFYCAVHPTTMRGTLNVH